MKKVTLASLFLLGMSNLFGGMRVEEKTVARDNVSIKYTRILKYKTNKFEWPYCIKIANLSNQPIVVDPSMISTPLVSYQDIAKALRAERKLFGGFFTLGAVTLGSMSWYLSKNMEKFKITMLPEGGTRIESGNPPWIVKAGGITSGITGLLGTYLLYKLFTETQKILEAKLAKETLHEPITIQPGESVEKLFWPKNPNDQVKIDFDAIKVLK